MNDNKTLNLYSPFTNNVTKYFTEKEKKVKTADFIRDTFYKKHN